MNKMQNQEQRGRYDHFANAVSRGFSVCVFVSILVFVVYRFADFFSLYAMEIVFGALTIVFGLFASFAALGMLMLFPLAAYEMRKARIRKLENENDELKRQLSR